MSCYNNGYNSSGYNPCATACYKTNYNCNPCQQPPCTQTVVNLPSTLTLIPTSSKATSNNQYSFHLSGSGLSGDWSGGSVTLIGGGGGTLACCPCSIVASVAGNAGTISNNNIIAGPLNISITGSSATGTGTLSVNVDGATSTGQVHFPSATVTCCNGVKTVTLTSGTVTW